ncbi:CaiB/BaiF CoA-transferase family protein [Aquimarina sp. RZ0]|uniref:CaiB/BaiF CoA transferase family protein n=1 Tax=Aquimarina sp. RZ0 TaxID=2607730 RepID=UPI0011F2B227|nr:CaiB/BaiF CoA-transferase family protein [Aquimarina sp. RZ0]KAA1246403.1 CoA transferase [Aquimarina sp. RZ0]
MNKPLEDVLVIDFSQFLSGPSASLRLADLGARVVKIEQPDTGDICRSLYVSNIVLNGESTIFQAINRNKESYQADLKDTEEQKKIYQLIKKADVVIHNFRPGVAERLGIDYKTISKLNPEIIYGDITGYGKTGVWKDKPGQDLLLQAISGLTGLSGNDGAGPVPMGLAIVDMLAGIHLTQGILAGLFKKARHKKGTLIEVSMLESIIEFQFESITTYYRDGGEPIQRTKTNNAHAYLGAPYGIYETKDGFIALAMGQIPVLGELLSCSELLNYTEIKSWYNQRDEIKEILSSHLKTKITEYWLSILEPADIWCSAVLNWRELFDSEGFKVLNMICEVVMTDGFKLKTTRCPIQINDQYLESDLGAPKLGEHTKKITTEFLLNG